MFMKKPSFVRRVCLLLLLAYGLLADPRMAWALGLSPAPPAKGCGMANCHCDHGPGAHAGTCCHLAADKLESKYPGVKAFMAKLQAQEEAALPKGSCGMKAASCGMGSTDEAPAPGRPHTLIAGPGAWLPSLAMAPGDAPVDLVVAPRGEALFKVPLI